MNPITKITLGVALVIFLVGVSVVIFLPPSSIIGDRVTESSKRQLQLTRASLAATENFSFDEAEKGWIELLASDSDNASVLLNLALNQVLRVDALTEAANNSLLTAEQRQAARSQLPTAIEKGRAAILEFNRASQDQVTTLWLQSRIDLREASLLPSSMGKSLRRELFDRLAQAIDGEVGAAEGAVILGGPFVEVIDSLEDPIQGLPKEILDRASTSLGRLSDEHPDNIYIALRAARLSITAEHADASAAVERTRTLALAIEPTLRSQTQPIGMTPDDLVNNILSAIEKGEWSQAENQMLLWFNVLNGTELVKTDRRRSSPHPLDKLSFESLRTLSATVTTAAPVTVGPKTLTFETAAVAERSDVAHAIPVDFDLDLSTDVVTASRSGQLALFKGTNGKQWNQVGELELGIDVTGLFAADLFMVDSSDSQRLQAKRDAAPASEAAVSSARHTTMPALVVFGNDGVRLVAMDGRAETEDAARLSVVTTPTGLEDVKQVSAAIAGDLDGDGDLDLAMATRDSGIRIFVNRGNRTFFEVDRAVTGGLANQRDIVDLAIVDLDRDLDLDVVALDGSTGRVGLVDNLLHLQFRYRELEGIAPQANATSVVVGDFDGNVSWDLGIITPTNVAIAFTQTADAGAWTVERVESIAGNSGASVLADLDNDSWQELLLADSSSVVAKRFAGGSRVDEVKLDLAGGASSYRAADFDTDGKLDLLAVTAQGPVVHLNRTPGGNHLDVRFRGIDDNNANSGRVNHYAIGSVVEVQFGANYRAHVIASPTTHFGLGETTDAVTLRVIFPNGLTQTIREPAVNTLVEEEQTLKGSCPYLYAWNGSKFVFVTDCLWAAPLGLQVSDGVVVKDRPWEYLKVDGDALAPRDGHYDLRITEELWEVAYFDHLALTAVDHPADVQVWTNEKVGPPNIAEPTIYAFRSDELRPLVRAADTTGQDVTATLRHADRDFVQGFDRRIIQGLCPPHWVDLDFGRVAGESASAESASSDKPNYYLVMTGWILPTDTSLNIQIDQNPELPSIEYPSVWVPDASAPEGWREAIPFMGFPGGKTKTIVVDVSEVIDPLDARLRIRTTAQIYWDHAELVVQSEPAEFTVTPLELVHASLDYHGFSQRVKPSETAPEIYDYDRSSREAKWPPLRGQFTNFGDVLPLLNTWDDAMVVMGSGDQMQLRFTAPNEPLKSGWKRDFVLHCVGWDKDADLNTLTGQSSYPLPFKAMSSYPPRHDQAAELELIHGKNHPHLQRPQSFREFWKRP